MSGKIRVRRAYLTSQNYRDSIYNQEIHKEKLKRVKPTINRLECVCVYESVCVCVCVCLCMRVCMSVCVSVYESEYGRERESVCVCM
jgi:hypothetical protein